ncbi:hypothetical protein [uncultured Psychrobacter sp.]|uniref:transketolase-like TK C-terminal-containing protein n=1 Tax=uncultured Psychrobacter sp. TaxID=259303 RepID=UPI0034579E04
MGLAIEVANAMDDKNIRVVSMPCWENYEQQSDEYKNALIPSRGAMKVSMEAGITMGWDKYIGPNGLAIGMDHFGASAPGKDLAKEFGFTTDQVEKKIRIFLKKNNNDFFMKKFRPKKIVKKANIFITEMSIFSIKFQNQKSTFSVMKKSQLFPGKYCLRKMSDMKKLIFFDEIISELITGLYRIEDDLKRVVTK